MALPIYTNINKQLRYKPYFHTYIAKWFTPKDRLPPFQFSRYEDASNPISSSNVSAVFKVINSETGTEYNWLTWWDTAQTLNTYDINEYYKYNGGTVTPADLPEGRYYIQISDGTNTWYSEEFFVCTAAGMDSVAPATGEFLKTNSSNFFLINATDKIKIN